MNSFLRTKSVTPLLLLALVAFPADSETAPLPEGIVDAFSPLSGFVIGARNGGYVVDLGRSDGLLIGDMLAVLGPARVLEHPVTGKAVQGLPDIDGVLSVARVEDKVAIARPASDTTSPAIGARVERYGGLPARFLDRTGKGDQLYAALRDALPHLEWRGYVREPGNAPRTPGNGDPGLVLFELTDEHLAIRGADHGLIRSYALGPETATMSTKALAGNAREPSRIAYRPEYPRAEPVVSLPGGVRIADFVRHQGELLLASTDGYRIRVHAIEGDRGVSERGSVEAASGEVVSVHWWQPGDTGDAYVATTSFDGDQAHGAVYQLRGDRLVPAARREPYILASFDTDGDGRRETLLGQSYVRDAFFGPRVHALALGPEGLFRRGQDFLFPPNFTVQGAVFADLTGDGRPELAFVRDHRLHIYVAGGDLLYRSPRRIGGSLSWVHYEVDPDLEFSPVNTVPFEISPLAIDLDGDGVRELVAVAADLSLLALSGAGPNVKKSWLEVFEYRDGNIVKGQLGPERDLPIQGLAAAGNGILLVMPASTSIIGGVQESEIISLPIDR